MDNRIKTAILVFGVVFLVFYWTHMAFVSAEKRAESSIIAVQEKTEKAVELLAQSMRPRGGSAPVENGLLTFIENTAKQTDLTERLTDVKPKKAGGAEIATLRLDSLTNDETIEFIRLMEMHPNIRLNNIVIKKRFDNEKRLNLYIEAEKI